MPRWPFKWGTRKWGRQLDSLDLATLRGVVGGEAPWLPTLPAQVRNGDGDLVTTPSGGLPSGAPLRRDACTHVYLLHDNWTVDSELVGVTDGSRTASFSNMIQQDALSLELYDPIGYWTDGPGNALLYPGRQVYCEMTVRSPAGTVVVPQGIYRLIGEPSLDIAPDGRKLTLSGVEWYRPILNGYAQLPPVQRENLPDYLKVGAYAAGDAIAVPPWPTASWNHAAVMTGVTTLTEFISWATAQFQNRLEIADSFDPDDGHFIAGKHWIDMPAVQMAGAYWYAFGGSNVPGRFVVDQSLKNPFANMFVGPESDTQSSGSELLIQRPSWQEVLNALGTRWHVWCVLAGDGKVHFRNAAVRGSARYVISDNPNVGGSIQIPAETLSKKPGQPPATIIKTLTQYNPQTGTSGKVLAQGRYVLNSIIGVPPRFREFGDVTQNTIIRVVSPPTVNDAAPLTLSAVEPDRPWVDDGTAIAIMVEMMRSAYQVTFNTDSAFLYLMLGDEIRVDVQGLRGVFTVINVDQPFSSASMSVTCGWRADA